MVLASKVVLKAVAAMEATVALVATEVVPMVLATWVEATQVACTVGALAGVAAAATVARVVAELVVAKEAVEGEAMVSVMLGAAEAVERRAADAAGAVVMVVAALAEHAVGRSVAEPMAMASGAVAEVALVVGVVVGELGAAMGSEMEAAVLGVGKALEKMMVGVMEVQGKVAAAPAALMVAPTAVAVTAEVVPDEAKVALTVDAVAEHQVDGMALEMAVVLLGVGKALEKMVVDNTEVANTEEALLVAPPGGTKVAVLMARVAKVAVTVKVKVARMVGTKVATSVEPMVALMGLVMVATVVAVMMAKVAAVTEVEAGAADTGGTEMAATAARPEASLVSSDQRGSGHGSVSVCEYARPRTGQ